MRRSCELVVVAMLAGCGDEAAEPTDAMVHDAMTDARPDAIPLDPIDPAQAAGIYRVDRQFAPTSPCDAPEQDVTPAAPYMKVVASGAGVEVTQCTNAAGTNCTAWFVFDTAVLGGFTTSTASGFLGGEIQMCLLNFYERSALWYSGGSRVEFRYTQYTQVLPPSSVCNADEARRMGTSMPCRRREGTDATRL